AGTLDPDPTRMIASCPRTARGDKPAARKTANNKRCLIEGPEDRENESELEPFGIFISHTPIDRSIRAKVRWCQQSKGGVFQDESRNLSRGKCVGFDLKR